MSDSDSEHEQQLTLEDLEGSDTEMISGDEDGPADIFTKQRVTVNNEPALRRLCEHIALPTDIPWSETQSITSSVPVHVVDPDDDLNREVAFYNQALEAAVQGRDRIKKEGGVFERPGDYFAEMIKTDDHMAKIRQKLLDENASIQASDRAKAQRELKKFGKKVQTEKRLEREKAKADALDKIQTLKKKRQGGDSTGNADDEFDVALASDDDEMKAYKSAGKGGKNQNGKRPAGSSSTTESRGKKVKKDQKFGFGGKKRFGKSNDADSSADVSGFNVKRNKSTSFKAGHKASKGAAKGGAKQRPGKGRRQNGAGRK